MLSQPLRGWERTWAVKPIPARAARWQETEGRTGYARPFSQVTRTAGFSLAYFRKLSSRHRDFSQARISAAGAERSVAGKEAVANAC